MKPARALALLTLVLGGSVLLLAPATAVAQQVVPRTTPPDTAQRGGWGEAPTPARPKPDFLFSQPRGVIELRAGMLFPRANSQVFAYSMQWLTLRRRDFDAPSLAADFGFRVTPRLDALLGVGYSRSSHWSEDRDYVEYVGNDTLPIRQKTSLRQVPLTVALRAYVLPRGQQIGHFVWLPARYAPYVGIAGGAVRHRFEQAGDFVDHNDFSINTQTYVSEGWSPIGQLFGGVDVGFAKRAALKVEARYSWSRADMGHDYEFDKIDLAGLQTTIGLSWRY